MAQSISGYDLPCNYYISRCPWPQESPQVVPLSLLPQKRTVGSVITMFPDSGLLEVNGLLCPIQAVPSTIRKSTSAPQVPLSPSTGLRALWAEAGVARTPLSQIQSTLHRVVCSVSEKVTKSASLIHSPCSAPFCGLSPSIMNLLQVQNCDQHGDAVLSQSLIQSLSARCVQNSDFGACYTWCDASLEPGTKLHNHVNTLINLRIFS